MDKIPEYAKVMTVTGAGTALSGGSLMLMKTFGAPAYISTMFGGLGTLFFVFGSIATVVQFYKYNVNGNHEHHN